MFDTIVNQGEFFSNHYMDALLSRDLQKGLRARWDAAEGRGEPTARTGLRSAPKPYFAARAAATEAADPTSLRALHDRVLAALAFTPSRGTVELRRGDTETVAVAAAAAVETATGLLLVALDAGFAAQADDLFDTGTGTDTGPGNLLTAVTVDAKTKITGAADAISYVFACDDPPRHVLVLAGGWLLLADRDRWADGRYLAVDLDTALDRHDNSELDTIAGLVSADALVPVEGPSVLDELTENSHKHAIGVSKDLREGIRASIELLANEVIRGRLAKHLKVYDGGVDPRELTRQCLRFMYRLLFLLYAEARPDLGVLPAKDDDYVAGYGLDRLRDLVLADLTTEQARAGTHIQESLRLLFRLVNDGYHATVEGKGTQHGFIFDDDRGEASLDEGLVFEPLRSELFATEATALLDGVALRNEVLQEVLSRLLLSKEQGRNQRGYVSYAELGINQLGAVYEGLMAYTGFFAGEDLYEVARGGEPADGTWVLPASAADGYPDDVFVTRDDPDGGPPQRVLHPKGAFVFRLSGRDRQRSASYYTPEVLTRCVVHHALAELLDPDGETTAAQRILDLTICEPALGSGAFLNEAINQLAAEYLARRQRELDAVIAPGEYEGELQRVKAHLALHCCYGVDQNATAIELAEVSLWLNCMHPGLQAPWFGLQLRRGNSLVGARRATYRRSQLNKAAWVKAAPADRPLSGGPLDTDEIHHFLLPAHGWAAAADAKQAKELAPERAETLRTWRKAVLKAPTDRQADRLANLARRVEALWAHATETVAFAQRLLRRPIPVYGTEAASAVHGGAGQEQILAYLSGPDIPLARLRLAMDAWAALWYWPLDAPAPANLDEWLATLEALLGVDPGEGPSGQLDLFDDLDALASVEDAMAADFGMEPVAAVVDAHPWLRTVRDVAAAEAFWHWELEFAPVFAAGGFDLQLGNPPWVRPRWLDDITLAETDPWFGVTDKATPKAFAARRGEVLADAPARAAYLAEVASASGLVANLGSSVLHPALAGIQTNLYMLFMDTTWRHQGDTGVVSLLQPIRHLVDPKGGPLRQFVYKRLRRHFLFLNALLLFEDVDFWVEYSICVYGPDRSIGFRQIANLLHPDTATQSMHHSGEGDLPGIKTPAGGWDLRPHAARVVHVDADVLASWARLFDEPGTPAAEARLVRPVTTADLEALAVLADQPVRLADHDYFWTRGHEEDRAKKDGVIRWETRVPESWDEVILQGPHFSVATPFAKQPNENCRHNQDYSAWDLESLPERVIPRTNYQRDCSRDKYEAAIDHWNGRPATDYWRVIWRRMTQPGLERSLHAALLHPGPCFVFTAHALHLVKDLTATLSGVLSSIPYDYLVKSSGRADLTIDFVRHLPLPHTSPYYRPLLLRTLRLNCLTADYAPLWEDLYDPAWRQDAWTDPTSTRPPLGAAGPAWTMATPLRRDFDRRMALVELDALAALILGLSAEQLCAMYRTQFAVLRKYEFSMFFDAEGRKLAKDHQTYSARQQKGDWERLQQWLADPGSVDMAPYVAPFTQPDREKEMTRAFEEFRRRRDEGLL